MFRIRKITLYKGIQKKEYSFSDNTYVYGHNSVGKTALTKIIDFVLGSSEILIHDGLDNIEYVGAYIENNNTQLWIKRNLQNDFFYKRTENSEYSHISLEKYKEIICEVISENLDTKAIKVYQKVFEETPTFRSFTFINFIDEIGQGDLGAVFTRGKEIKHLVRIRKIMDFFFNYENIEKIYEKKVELEKLELEQKRYNDRMNQYKHSVNKVRNLFTRLSLTYSDDMLSNYNLFKSFKKNFSRNPPPIGDIVYLTRASYSLSEELKLYDYLKEQSQRAVGRKQRTERLLTLLKSILADNTEYSEDINTITKTINEIQQDKLILSLADYESTKEKISKEKKMLDDKINILNSQASENDYENTLKTIALLEDHFAVINNIENLNQINKINNQIIELKKQIKELKNSYNQKGIIDFNKHLTDIYINSKVKNVTYIDDDRQDESFSLSFDPFSQVLVAKHKENNVVVSYTPGSMARHSHLQLLVYLCMLDYLHKNFSNFIYLPILIIDSADQAMEDKSFEEIYPSLVELAKNIGVQTIFISKFKPETIAREDFLDITDGLNPFHLKNTN